MKETSFIEQNKKKWNRFEQVYESQSQDPEELSDLYMDITDDLSYAQTFYRRRTVRVYLNQLAQKVFTGVHKQKGESFKKFISVWKVSLPLEIYRSRKNLLFALVAFIIYALIGAVTTHLDPNFASVVLGQGYVDVTNENIANLNPLAIYEDDDQLAMFINITTNNLKVAFLTFFVGFFFTLGTHMLMFYNGVMLGTFQYFFHTKGLLVTSFLGIWIHGSFEISAIVLAGGAGITAGNGLLFPKSYTRIQSLQLSTKRGLKIMLSLVPFIIAAGFLESFVTANYQMLPDWSKWAIIIFSFALILFFYVFYPIYVARKYPELVYQEPVENFKPKTTFRFDKIRSVGDIIADSFRMYRLQFKKFTKIIFLIVFPLVIAAVWLQDINHYDLQQKQYWYDWSAQLELMIGYGYHNLQDVFMVVVWTFIFALMLTAVLWSVNTIGEEFSWKSFFAFVGKRLLGIWLANIFLMLLIMTLPSWGLMLAVFVMPFFMLNGAAAGLDDEKFGVRFKRGFKYSAQHYGKSLLVLLILIGLTVIMMQPIAFVFSIHDGWSNEPMVRDVLDMVADFTKRIAQIYTDDYMFWANVLRQLVYVLFMLFLLPLLFITMSFGYYSELEKTEANGLKNAFKKFGKRSRTKETSVDFE
ncbi:MAG: stage II sporulation protein M [Crocinitomicaceae bacterium]|nr:stage II sporulation protein M [Crocinitomicaceae bacterium]MDG1659288.1 stage II sporulation protein M [Crocinitomicaceae bacterium]